MNRRLLADWIERHAPPALPLNTRRRTLIKMATALAVSSLAAPLASCATRPTPKLAYNPFTLGVASGSPRADSVVLWTRLAPPSRMAERLPSETYDVRWEIAHDENFRAIVKSGSAAAPAQLAHSVHAEVGGLEPARWYWYRFMTDDAVSAVGRTRTAPALDATNAQLR